MLKRNNNENVLKEYIDYLKDKGKIIKIKDTNKEINIKFFNEIIYYFLLIVSIALIVLLIICLFDSSFSITSEDGERNIIIVIGVALLTAIVIGVTFNVKKKIKLNISYPDENQMKINNKIINIEKDDCLIDIRKKFKYNPGNIEGAYVRDYHEIKYFLIIKGNRMSKSFRITNGTEEQLKDLIYNFEYEISDFKKQKSEFIKNAQDVLEELYDKGSVSKDKINKLYENKDKNE